jgi:anti-sigma regulatory factor (Ser/Thr protein kinase)
MMAAAQRETAYSVAIPHHRSGVRTARHTVSDELYAGGVRPPVLDDAVLVVSELVSNAIRHAAPLPSGDIQVGWSLFPDLVHIEIVDGGAPTRPQARSASVSSLGGRGLEIVRCLAAEWGVDERSDTVTVWADLPRSPAGARWPTG